MAYRARQRAVALVRAFAGVGAGDGAAMVVGAAVARNRRTVGVDRAGGQGIRAAVSEVRAITIGEAAGRAVARARSGLLRALGDIGPRGVAGVAEDAACPDARAGRCVSAVRAVAAAFTQRTSQRRPACLAFVADARAITGGVRDPRAGWWVAV